jgi:hypothetical protein
LRRLKPAENACEESKTMMENDLLRVCLDLMFGCARLAAAVEKRDRIGGADALPGPVSTLDGLCSLLEALTRGFQKSRLIAIEKSTLPHLLESLTVPRLAPVLTRQIARLVPEDRVVVTALSEELRATPWENQLEKIYPTNGLWRDVRLRAAALLSAVDVSRSAPEPDDRCRAPIVLVPLCRRVNSPLR